MKKNLLISVATLTACIVTFFSQPSFAFVTSLIESAKSVVLMLGKVERALPEAEIAKLSRQIHNAGDLSKVATSLERSGLPKVALEDTYLRITVNQGKLEKVEAEKLFGNLSGVTGFKETLRKVAGVNEMQVKGHLQELRIANRAKELRIRSCFYRVKNLMMALKQQIITALSSSSNDAIRNSPKTAQTMEEALFPCPSSNHGPKFCTSIRN